MEFSVNSKYKPFCELNEEIRVNRNNRREKHCRILKNLLHAAVQRGKNVIDFEREPISNQHKIIPTSVVTKEEKDHVETAITTRNLSTIYFQNASKAYYQ